MPTVNIGDRQRGRIESDSVISCEGDTKSINTAISKALDQDFVKVAKATENPYGDGNAAKRIISILEKVEFPIDIKKRFVDAN